MAKDIDSAAVTDGSGSETACEGVTITMHPGEENEEEENEEMEDLVPSTGEVCDDMGAASGGVLFTEARKFRKYFHLYTIVRVADFA